MQGTELVHSSERSAAAQNCVSRPLGLRYNRSTKPCRHSLHVVAQRTAAKTSDALKSDLLSKAGSKNGLDRTPEQAQELRGIITELASTSGDVRTDLTGTTWTLRYTDSTSSSAGKLGPFIGYVEQDFPSDQPGRYYNKVAVGPVKAKLQAKYDYLKDDKIEVNFVEFTFGLGPFKISKDFGGKGFWTLRYTDSNLRVLDTNQDHVFVLERVHDPKLQF